MKGAKNSGGHLQYQRVFGQKKQTVDPANSVSFKRLTHEKKKITYSVSLVNGINHPRLERKRTDVVDHRTVCAAHLRRQQRGRNG